MWDGRADAPFGASARLASPNEVTIDLRLHDLKVEQEPSRPIWVSAGWAGEKVADIPFGLPDVIDQRDRDLLRLRPDFDALHVEAQEKVLHLCWPLTGGKAEARDGDLQPLIACQVSDLGGRVERNDAVVRFHGVLRCLR